MDIVKLKAEIAQYDQQEKRMPVYACLKEAWASDPPSEQLTVLVIAQMLNYLEWIDGAYKIVVEAPDEFSLYWDFLTEAATYGFEHYRQGKMFLWEMCRVLVMWPTYLIQCKYIPRDGEKLLEQLVAEGKALYPTSALFDCLTPFNEDEDKELIRQLTPAQRKRIREELTEWNLQENMMDREMLESVGDVMDDPEKKQMMIEEHTWAFWRIRTGSGDNTKKHLPHPSREVQYFTQTAPALQAESSSRCQSAPDRRPAPPCSCSAARSGDRPADRWAKA